MTNVLVTGFFQRLHAGHLDFLEMAGAYGDLHVCVGSDENYKFFKDKYPLESQEERMRMLRALSMVEKVYAAQGVGDLDFEPLLLSVKPDYFVINRDGDADSKRKCCEVNGVEYIVLDKGHERESQHSKDPLRIQYRLCLAGGWLDQPFVSKYHAGGVVVLSLEPVHEYMDRAGMATSTRKLARQIWNERIPRGDHETVSKILFGAENPPGKVEVAGSQDAIGLVYPGLSMPFYEGNYWPIEIKNTVDPEIMLWLDQVIHIVPSYQRPGGYNPLAIQNLSYAGVKTLAESADLAWEGALDRDIEKFGDGLKRTYGAYRELLPYTVPDELAELVSHYENEPGYNVTGAGGGGYIIVVSDSAVSDEVPMSVRALD